MSASDESLPFQSKTRSDLPRYATLQSLDYPKVIAFLTVHLFVLFSPFFFSAAGLALCLCMIIVLAQFGLVLGYHRLLAHRSFCVPRSVKYMLAVCGTLALQGGPVSWVAVHRLHHRTSDQVRDPHSPLVSFLWAYFLWAFFHHPELHNKNKWRLAEDIHNDCTLRFLEKFQIPIVTAFAMGMFVVGLILGGKRLGISLLLWGYFMPVIYAWHAVALLVSVTHLWGYRRYQTPDNSHNCWWVALLTFGEGWHNNHHADSRSAMMGHRWFELDPTYWVIRSMVLLGLAYDVRMPRRIRSVSLRTTFFEGIPEPGRPDSGLARVPAVMTQN